MLEIFSYTDTDFSVSETEEAALIERAQAGEEAATLALMQAYGPALRSAVSRFKGGVRDGQVSQSAESFGTPSRSIEDLQSTAIIAFLEVITQHDPALNPRLAGRVTQRLTAALADEATSGSAFAVPERTLSRFYGILREAEGDTDVALGLVADFGMSRETFLSVLSAVQAGSLDEATDDASGATGARQAPASPVFTPSPVVDVEDKMLVDMAFGAVSDEEERICRLSFGFTEYDPQPDAEVAHRMGLSRPTVQRKRGKALDKMRKAVGVTHA